MSWRAFWLMCALGAAMLVTVLTLAATS